MTYIDRDELKDYPFDGEFYTTEIDTTEPLEQQEEVEVLLLKCKCDIQEESHARVNGFIKAMYAVYVPYDETKTITINRGCLFRGEIYGLVVSGKVEGVFPSQFGGFKCDIQANEIGESDE